MSVCFHSTQARGHTVADRTRHNVYVNVFWHDRHGTSLLKTERRTTSVLKDDVFLLFTESVEWSPFLFLLGLCSHLIFSLVSDDNHSKGWSCLKRLLCRRNEKWIFRVSVLQWVQNWDCLPTNLNETVPPEFFFINEQQIKRDKNCYHHLEISTGVFT